MPENALDLSFLDELHPIYRANQDAWERNERRLEGGDDVLDELRPFMWEDADGRHYAARRNEATYANYPAIYAEAMAGHLFREAPSPERGLDFGSLGEVRRDRDAARPTRAELVYYNVDGTGNDGSHWDAFWNGVQRRASATGHRWILAEAPKRDADAPQPSQADEIAGSRPYLIEYSPLAVTNWHFERGRLAFAVVRVPDPRPFDIARRADKDGYYLFVRDGFAGLGPAFEAGGWWLIDPDRIIFDSGDWSRTLGEIPLFLHFYERAQSSKARPRLSRAGTTELGQLAVSTMNLESAADFDAWDAGASLTYLLGVDREGFNLAMEKIGEGSKTIPVPANGQDGRVPQVYDGSAGAVAAQVFQGRLEAKHQKAMALMAREATSTPDSSGRSKEAGFAESRGPKLALLASELESSMNTAIYFLELRFGASSPSGSATWTRKFDLRPMLDEIRDMLELEDAAGIRSPTLDARALTAAVREKRLAADDAELTAIEEEYRQAAADRQTAAAQGGAFDRALRDLPSLPPRPPAE